MFVCLVFRLVGSVVGQQVSFVPHDINPAAEYPACAVLDVNNPGNTNNAIVKRVEDGIVLINENVCIGCRNCEQACPYGAPQFNSSTRKVEKCTLCIHRIYDSSGNMSGFLPACVTTCVGNALHFMSSIVGSGANAPAGFADPQLTVPSVNFRNG